MIDFHSHILPGIDDGSKNVETSLKMLSISKSGGVDTVVLTPHCHPMSQEHIDKFLERRENSFRALSSETDENQLLEEWKKIKNNSKIYPFFTLCLVFLCFRCKNKSFSSLLLNPYKVCSSSLTC